MESEGCRRLRQLLGDLFLDVSTRMQCIKDITEKQPEVLLPSRAVGMREIPLAFALGGKSRAPKSVVELLIPPGYLSPLFFAMEHCPLQHVVVSLLQLYPLGASETNEKGQTPLHVAFQHAGALPLDKGSEFHLVLSLLRKRNPDACFVADREGNLPVHIVCCSAHSTDAMIRIAARENSAAWLVANRQGELPLHVLIKTFSHQHNLPKILKMHQTNFPQTFSARTRLGELPVHLLLKILRNGDQWGDLGGYGLLDLVSTWLPKLCPNNGDLCLDGNGNTPLHIACCYFPTHDVVKSLSRWADCVNHNGESPLHILCRAFSDPRSIFQAPSANGWFQRRMLGPRHRLETAQELIQRHPEAVVRVCNSGLLPLHHLCLGACMQDPGVVRLLLQTFPAALS